MQNKEKPGASVETAVAAVVQARPRAREIEISYAE